MRKILKNIRNTNEYSVWRHILSKKLKEQGSVIAKRAKEIAISLILMEKYFSFTFLKRNGT